MRWNFANENNFKDSKSCWKMEWILPYETPWSVFEKFCYANVVDRNKLLQTWGMPTERNMKNRNFYDLSGFDNDILQKALRYDLKQHNKIVIEPMVDKLLETSPVDNWFRTTLFYCSHCIRSGYHSWFHQFRLLHHCPIHLTKLLDLCPNCGIQIPFLLSDKTLDKGFMCKCGYLFADLSDIWKLWPEAETEIYCEDTKIWLNTRTETLNEKPILFIDSHIDVNPYVLHVMAKSLEPIMIKEGIGDRTTFSTAYINQRIFQSISKPTYRFNTEERQVSRFTEETYRNRIMNSIIYEHTRQIFKSLDKYVRKHVIADHKSCIKRFQFLYKEPNEPIPPICPFAYAYIFWKRSLLNELKFFNQTMGAYRKNFQDNFDVFGKVFYKKLKDIYDQYLSQTNDFNITKLEGLLWIIGKVAGKLYYQYFINWLDVSMYWSSRRSKPDWETFTKLSMNNMPFFVIRHPRNNTIKEPIEYHTWMDCQNIIETQEVKCPYSSNRKRKIKKTEISYWHGSANIDEFGKYEFKYYIDDYLLNMT